MLTYQCIVIVTVLCAFSEAAVPYGRTRARSQYRQPVAYATAASPNLNYDAASAVPVSTPRRYVAATPVRYANTAPVNTGAYVAGPEENYVP